MDDNLNPPKIARYLIDIGINFAGRLSVNYWIGGHDMTLYLIVWALYLINRVFA